MNKIPTVGSLPKLDANGGTKGKGPSKARVARTSEYQKYAQKQAEKLSQAQENIQRQMFKNKTMAYYKSFPHLAPKKHCTAAEDKDVLHWASELNRCRSSFTKGFQENSLKSIIFTVILMVEKVTKDYYNPFPFSLDGLYMGCMSSQKEWQECNIDEDIKIFCIEYNIFSITDVRIRLALKLCKFMYLVAMKKNGPVTNAEIPKEKVEKYKDL